VGDATFFLTNRANGTQWHLEVPPNALMWMSSNVTGDQDGQRFLFSEVEDINDQRYSTLLVNLNLS
jgi:hypothetical protein